MPMLGTTADKKLAGRKALNAQWLQDTINTIRNQETDKARLHTLFTGPTGSLSPLPYPS
jgi:predicted component of type VI protein secretion system